MEKNAVSLLHPTGLIKKTTPHQFKKSISKDKNMLTKTIKLQSIKQNTSLGIKIKHNQLTPRNQHPRLLSKTNKQVGSTTNKWLKNWPQ